MNSLNISFIGAGNMARSLISGLLADGRDPATIWISDTTMISAYSWNCRSSCRR